MSSDYVIKKGDTLASIAKTFGTAAESLAKANDIKNVNSIFAGENLHIDESSQKIVEDNLNKSSTKQKSSIQGSEYHKGEEVIKNKKGQIIKKYTDESNDTRVIELYDKKNNCIQKDIYDIYGKKSRYKVIEYNKDKTSKLVRFDSDGEIEVEYRDQKENPYCEVYYKPKNSKGNINKTVYNIGKDKVEKTAYFKNGLVIKCPEDTNIETIEGGKVIMTMQSNLSSDNNINIDGKIGVASQGETGDCWLLSGLSALSYTKNGRQVIKDSIHKDKKGSIIVELKGVNKSYKITGKEIIKSQDRLSLGDDDARAFELAIEKYRKELIQKKDSRQPREFKNFTSHGTSSDIGDGNITQPLKGGWSAQALSLITGKEADYVTNGKTMFLIGENNAEKYLEQIKKTPDRYAAICSFKEKGNGFSDEHTYAIKGFDGKNVIVVNPWDSAAEIKIAKDKFLELYEDMDVLDMQ